MARRGISGQMNMFDFFSDGEVEMVSLMPAPEPEEPAPVPVASELETEPEEESETVVSEPEPEKPVAVVPALEPEAAEPAPVPVVSEPEPEEPIAVAPAPAPTMGKDKPVLFRQICHRDGTKKAAVSYVNYNRIRIDYENGENQIFSFDTSKEALEFYYQRIEELEKGVEASEDK